MINVRLDVQDKKTEIPCPTPGHLFWWRGELWMVVRSDTNAIISSPDGQNNVYALQLSRGTVGNMVSVERWHDPDTTWNELVKHVGLATDIRLGVDHD